MLVIGGGITGAGVALDAASRGLRTALVEKGDFASGTSSKSSKMVHGGIRYLQQREFRLVYENLAERQRLLDNAPHLVTPLPFLIPLFGRDGVVSKTVARSYASALWMYDLTGGWRIGERHREVGKEEALAHLPTLEHRPPGGRLPLFRRPGRRRPADAHRPAHRGVRVRGRGRQLHTGRPPHDGRRRRRQRRRRASGPRATSHRTSRSGPGWWSTPPGVWADEVRALDEGSDPHADPPGQGRPRDRAGRPPALRHRRGHPGPQGQALHLRRAPGRGPTSSISARPTPTTRARSTTPRARPRTSTTCWRRPTTSPPRTSPGPTSPACGPACARCWRRRPRAGTSRSARRTSRAATPSATSAHGVVTVTGGKLTTYRKMAQDTVDAVVGRLGESPRRRRCVTKSLPLIGATTKTRDPVALAQPQARLLGRYGTESRRRARPGRRPPRAARTGGGGVALHRRRAGVRRPRGDGAHARRRAVAPDPGHDPARPATPWPPPPPSPRSSRPTWVGTRRRPRTRRPGSSESCQKELLTAGLDLR